MRRTRRDSARRILWSGTPSSAGSRGRKASLESSSGCSGSSFDFWVRGRLQRSRGAEEQRRRAGYVHLVDTKFTKWSNFVREAWLIKEKWNKRSCLKPPMNADARRCSAPLIGVDRRFPTLGGMRSARYV